MTGKLDGHLREIDRAANEMFAQLTEQKASAESVTEVLKAADQIEWVRRMNDIQNRVREIVNARRISRERFRPSGTGRHFAQRRFCYP